MTSGGDLGGEAKQDLFVTHQVRHTLAVPTLDPCPAELVELPHALLVLKTPRQHLPTPANQALRPSSI